MQQIGALPYRISPEGELEVLMITSRGNGRWIIPTGNLIQGLKPHQVAAREAFEEAGINGKADGKSIGKFRYNKQRPGRSDADVEVTVFPMLVTEQLQDWPERRQRERRWLNPIAASHLADDLGLKRLLQVFHLTAQT
ncbi:MAG TPA: NUDIX hydrolase [Novosphingobium sp.]